MKLVAKVKAIGVKYLDEGGGRDVRVLDRFGDIVVEGIVDESQLNYFHDGKPCFVHFCGFHKNTEMQSVEAEHIVEIILRAT